MLKERKDGWRCGVADAASRRRQDPCVKHQRNLITEALNAPHTSQQFFYFFLSSFNNYFSFHLFCQTMLLPYFSVNYLFTKLESDIYFFFPLSYNSCSSGQSSTHTHLGTSQQSGAMGLQYLCSFTLFQ